MLVARRMPTDVGVILVPTSASDILPIMFASVLFDRWTLAIGGVFAAGAAIISTLALVS
jgi:hypothetical protein